jgi:hypothetical protein
MVSLMWVICPKSLTQVLVTAGRAFTGSCNLIEKNLSNHRLSFQPFWINETGYEGVLPRLWAYQLRERIWPKEIG